jgi:hypothetical protein
VLYVKDDETALMKALAAERAADVLALTEAKNDVDPHSEVS